MLLPHAAGVSITLRRLCSVYNVVYLDIPLRWEYHQLLYITCHISHYGAGLKLVKLVKLCILCSLFGHALNMGLSHYGYGLK